MDRYDFTLVLKGSMKAYSPGQIVDHLSDWRTREAMGAIISSWDRSNVSVESIRGVVELYNRPETLEFASKNYLEKLQYIRSQIAEGLYHNYMALVAADIHRLGKQIILLSSVRDGFFTRPRDITDRANDLIKEIEKAESRFGFNHPQTQRTWVRLEGCRDYRNYLFKFRDFKEIAIVDQQPFWDAADRLMAQFNEIFCLKELEEFVNQKGITLEKGE